MSLRDAGRGGARGAQRRTRSARRTARGRPPRGTGHGSLARNWRCRLGEIDIVARDGGDLVFIEVKTRTSHDFGHPFEAITPIKLARLRRLAIAWCEARMPRHPASASTPSRCWPPPRPRRSSSTSRGSADARRTHPLGRPARAHGLRGRGRGRPLVAAPRRSSSSASPMPPSPRHATACGRPRSTRGARCRSASSPSTSRRPRCRSTAPGSTSPSRSPAWPPPASCRSSPSTASSTSASSGSTGGSGRSTGSCPPCSPQREQGTTR